MSNYAIIRLGKDSVADIRAIDALNGSPDTPLEFTVHCKQVPFELEPGDYVFFCFGSDNDKGAPTAWVRGVRALGTIVSKTGGPNYMDPWHVAVEIKVILPQTVSRRDILAHAPAAYYWCSGIPSIGIEANSQQTIQTIKVAESNQSVAALAYSIAAQFPIFKTDTIIKYPDLKPLFDFQPPSPLGPTTAEVSNHLALKSNALALSKLLERLQTDTAASFLRLDSDIAHRLASCLLTKRFLITTGLSGSGKTKLAQAFARWLTPDPEFVDSSDETKGKNPNPYYKVVSVGADWSGNENILGYPNGLHPEEYFTKPALELILHAASEDHKDDPHFLILDEMNLSHVERYFADILSAIESDEKIHLHRDKERKVGDEPIEQEIDLPKNLFIIGTVNIDETTHMFSPKVLDRANVIEFRMKDTELESFLENPLKPDLNKLDGKGEAFCQAFVDAAKNPTEVPEDARTRFQCEMLLFFKVLQKHGAEFGYRVTHEAGRFVSFYKAIGSESDVETWFKEAFDSIIVQKFLPKLHGSESKLRGVLFSLAHLCSNKRECTGSTLEDNTKLIKDSADEAIQKGINNSSSDDSPTQVLAKVLGGEFEKAHYPLSFEKIERMWRAAHENGFASFAES
jgi:energy-coupling factor transporter ATP-binding protein EcfA2